MPTAKSRYHVDRRMLSTSIRETRLRLGINQTAFGRMLRVGQRAISNWELGKGITPITSGVSFARLLLDAERNAMNEDLRSVEMRIEGLIELRVKIRAPEHIRDHA